MGSQGHDGRRYAVLGATGGVGSALARRLAGEGAEVWLAARGEGALDELAREIEGVGRPVDARRFEEVESFLSEAAAEGLDGVASCIGSVLIRPAHLTSEDQYEETLETNLRTAFATVRGAARVLDGPASVVLVSTAVVRMGVANHEAIAAAKGGVEGLVRSAAATYAGRELRFNAVAPGLVRTPATERITKNEQAADASRRMHALGRLGEPEDVAAAMAWLLSPATDWVTGQVLGVDGGLGSVRSGRG